MVSRSDFRRYLTYSLSFHKYPRYVSDIFLKLFLSGYLRHTGIEVGRHIVWMGKPIISKTPGSSIKIGPMCAFCSRSGQTALGVQHPVIIRTLKAGAGIEIGANVRMSGTTICASDHIRIGERCVIGANVTIADTDFHSLNSQIRSSPDDFNDAHSKPVVIEDDVFIGGGAYILKGVKIGQGAIIGAGSVVSKDVEKNAVVAGNPARFIKYNLAK
ncbi:MAG: acyltransferase [Bacteroidota bacterium]